MREKDISQKALESYNDVFSDIVNVLLFDGKQVIDQSELSEATEFSYYKASGEIRMQERDIAKYWNNSAIQIAMIGLENQSDPDPDMPLRVISYDGAAYRDQLNKNKSSNQRYPVITLVLYLGYKYRWGKYRTLKECLSIPEVISPYINDYHINLFEIAYLDDDVINRFKSDFKVLADYCSQMRRTGQYVESKDALVHPKEVMNAMTAFTGDKMFEEAYNTFIRSSDHKEGDVVTMEGIMTKKINEYLELGMDAGKASATKEIVLNAHANGHSAQAISDFNCIPLDKVTAIIQEAEAE